MFATSSHLSINFSCSMPALLFRKSNFSRLVRTICSAYFIIRIWPLNHFLTSNLLGWLDYLLRYSIARRNLISRFSLFYFSSLSEVGRFLSDLGMLNDWLRFQNWSDFSCLLDFLILSVLPNFVRNTDRSLSVWVSFFFLFPFTWPSLLIFDSLLSFFLDLNVLIILIFVFTFLNLLGLSILSLLGMKSLMRGLVWTSFSWVSWLKISIKVISIIFFWLLPLLLVNFFPMNSLLLLNFTLILICCFEICNFWSFW